jgi:ferredoxin
MSKKKGRLQVAIWNCRGCWNCVDRDPRFFKKHTGVRTAKETKRSITAAEVEAVAPTAKSCKSGSIYLYDTNGNQLTPPVKRPTGLRGV